MHARIILGIRISKYPSCELCSKIIRPRYVTSQLKLGEVLFYDYIVIHYILIKNDILSLIIEAIL